MELAVYALAALLAVALVGWARAWWLARGLGRLVALTSRRAVQALTTRGVPERKAWQLVAPELVAAEARRRAK